MDPFLPKTFILPGYGGRRPVLSKLSGLIRVLVAGILFLVITPLKAQYVGGIGAYVSTPLPVDSKDFSNPNYFVYELSIKVFTSASKDFDIIGGLGPDYYDFTILAEAHTPIAYPFDWYLGIGGHVGSWKPNHWDNTPKLSDNTFAGVDGSFGLQCTIFPIAITAGVRPVYNLYGGEQFYWLKQVGLRICF